VADVVTAYTIASSGGTVVMNQGTMGDGTDKYWLTQGPRGLDGAALRVPTDPVPFGSGAIVHSSWEFGMRAGFEGVILIESTQSQAFCQTIRNDMINDLRNCLRGALAPNSATVSWTETGIGSRSLTMFYEVPLESSYIENYMLMSFTFGLLSEASSF
jgi:hypothetical protein